MYVRAKNELGEWGLTQRDSMYILRPANDHCDGASPLVLGTNVCGGTISSSTFATDTSGIAVGSCNASNEQGDVWFYAIAPANGRIHCVSVTCVSVSVPCWPCAERACVERYSAIVDHRGSAWHRQQRPDKAS